MSGPQAQFVLRGKIPALHAAEGVEEALLLFHHRRSTHFSGATDLGETELIGFAGVGGEPVITAAAAVSAAVIPQGQGRVAVVQAWLAVDPLGLVGAFAFQLQRLTGATEQACAQQAKGKNLIHWASP